ncbi:MAG TPA: hypothetical protein PK156_21120 [Polyangium sp.]|nr:hypothetical protein [Polyangium sp.]
MKMRGFASWTIGFFLIGCGQSNSEAPRPIASTAASSAPAKPSVQRKTTPKALRVADEQACTSGKTDACRRMADRYRGYGHPAGCGLEREAPEWAHGRVVDSMQVRIKRTMDDEEGDQKAFLVWIGKACDLGDEDACTIERAVREKHQPYQLFDTEDGAVRSDPQTSAPIGFHALWATPEEHEKFLQKRKDCFHSAASDCNRLSRELITRIKQEKRTELTPEIMAKLQAIGERTLDYASLYMMLDKHGYGPENVAPLKVEASKTLVRACEEGACVCGDAAASLPPDDPRVLDLARWGCENGEAMGCYLLGKLHEEGRGVEKDEAFARSLYELACPATRSSADYTWSDFERAACTRLSELAQGGTNPPKDKQRAVFYQEYTCRNPGYERDHGYCLKMAKFWTTGILSQSCGADESWCRNSAARAEELMNGPKYDPADGKECERPSVKAACDAMQTELEALKKPKTKKK